MQYEGAERGRGRAVLSAFLLREGMDGASVDDLLARLEPLFGFAGRGDYQLDALAGGGASVADAVAAATASPIRAVRMVRLSEIRSIPTHGGRARLLGTLGTNIRHGVWIDIWKREADALRAALGDDRKAALAAAYADALGLRLRAAFDASFVGAIGHDLALHAWNTVEETAFYHLGLSLAGETGRAARLGPLLAALPAAIPLCRARDDAGVWLVLAG